MTDKPVSVYFTAENRTFWLHGLFWGLVTFGLAFALRMVEWPCWQNPEYRLGSEWLLATHDAYHWVAGAEGFGHAVGHPMAVMLRGMADLLGTYPAAVAFWFPALLSCFVAVIVYAWVWALGSMEAGVAAGLLTSLAPGFLARTLLGYYDTDLVTLFFPLLMTLAPACWAMRYMLLPQLILKKLIVGSGLAAAKRLWGSSLAEQDLRLGNPLRWQWVVLLGVSGVISWWTQEWHSVFPYLTRYNVCLLAFMSLVMAPRGRRNLLLLGSLAYALPTLGGPLFFGFSALLMTAGWTRARQMYRLRQWLCRPWVLILLWLGVGFLFLSGELLQTITHQLSLYMKKAEVSGGSGALALIYPPAGQALTEVQDLGLLAVLAYFHPWHEAAALGLLGFVWVIFRRPGALFLLPLAALGLLSTKMGGRMVMFGAPIVAVGLTLPLYWLLQRLLRRLRPDVTGILTSALLLALLVAPFVNIIPAMSQGPMINRRHAEMLSRAQTVVPKDATLWLWWDWGYAAHHFARRHTIADGARNAGAPLYLSAAVLGTDNPRFARQLIRYTSRFAKGRDPFDEEVAGAVFAGLDAQQAQDLMDRLRSPETALRRAAVRDGQLRDAAPGVLDQQFRQLGFRDPAGRGRGPVHPAAGPGLQPGQGRGPAGRRCHAHPSGVHQCVRGDGRHPPGLHPAVVRQPSAGHGGPAAGVPFRAPQRAFLLQPHHGREAGHGCQPLQFAHGAPAGGQPAGSGHLALFQAGLRQRVLPHLRSAVGKAGGGGPHELGPSGSSLSPAPPPFPGACCRKDAVPEGCRSRGALWPAPGAAPSLRESGVRRPHQWW